MSIPHARFIEQLKYKAELVAMTVLINEESYTSASSFLDLDPIPVYQEGVKHSFSGKRIKGLGTNLLMEDLSMQILTLV